MTEVELLQEISEKLDDVFAAVVLAVEFVKLIAFVAWAGVGYISFRLLVRRNWRIDYGRQSA